MKAVRNGRGKVKTSPQRPQGLPRSFPDPNRTIHDRHRRCRWRQSEDNLLHFCSHLEIYRDCSKIQHISPTSPPSASPMAAMYRPIWARRLRRKSMKALRTCPDLPPTISDNFHFWVFVCIFDQSQCISRFEQKDSKLVQFRRHRQH